MPPVGFHKPVFDGMGWASMRIVAEDDLGALADRVALELPWFVEQVRLIDQPATRVREHSVRAAA